MKTNRLIRWASGLLVTAASIASLGFSSAAAAVPMWCAAMVSNLFVSADSNAFVNLDHTSTGGGAGYVRICNIRQAITVGLATVDAPTCMAWFALARTSAQPRDKMSSRDGEISSYQQLGVYEAAPLPGYVILA
jgi:hypothetical protein